MTTAYESVAGVGRPARDALREAGYPDLESLDGVDYAELAALHGVGTRGLERLHAALADRGLGLGGQVPEPEARQAVFTEGHTGAYAADIRTKPRSTTPAEFVEELESPRRVEHGRLLLEIFGRATGEQPVMWGPSMIGYGEVHYRYATGREVRHFPGGLLSAEGEDLAVRAHRVRRHAAADSSGQAHCRCLLPLHQQARRH